MVTHFQKPYPAKGEGSTIIKEDHFYSIYGIQHSPEYRSRFSSDLKKMLPRIPLTQETDERR